MSDALDKLTRVLSHETELHESLLKVAEDKRSAIIEGDLDLMEESLQQEQVFIAEVEKAEVERIRITAAVQAELGLTEEPVKLARIIEVAPDPQAGGLQTVHRELTEVVTRLRYRTRQNAELMKASMEHVEGFLRAVAEACASQVGYGSDGLKRNTSVSLLDRSA